MAQDFAKEINEILTAAADDGRIMLTETQEGRFTFAGGKIFPSDKLPYDAAESARYADALDSLFRHGLAKQISNDLYELTSRGFTEARRLRSLQSGKANQPGYTTKVGFVNSNLQVVIRNTGLPGTDHGQQIYQLGCSICGCVYGANGADIHDRKCPKCGRGAEGSKYS
jgi:hypothetical protein